MKKLAEKDEIGIYLIEDSDIADSGKGVTAAHDELLDVSDGVEQCDRIRTRMKANGASDLAISNAINEYFSSRMKVHRDKIIAREKGILP